MTNREFDTMIMGFAVGALLFTLVGYWIGKRVERWRNRGPRITWSPDTSGKPWDAGFSPMATTTAAQRRSARRKPDHVPLRKPMRAVTMIPVVRSQRDRDAIQSDFEAVGRDISQAIMAADATAKTLDPTPHPDRADARAALTGAGYKCAEAEAALDACTPAERSGGLESWIAAALRRVKITSQNARQEKA